MIVDFWLDPTCPLTWVGAQWMREVARERSIEIRWHVMSLSVLNEHRDDDPENDPEGYLWIPARIAAAVQVEHGSAALGRFHVAIQHTEGWDFGAVLAGCGLPPELAAAGTSTDYDAALRASHEEGMRLIGRDDVGTPIVAVPGADGERVAFFGPVLAELPEPAECLRVWDALMLLATVPAFREFKGQMSA